MGLRDYIQRRSNENITFFRFQQPENHCFPLSNAWLRWFLSASEAEILAGNFLPYIKDFPDIMRASRDVALSDCRSLDYHRELNSKLKAFSLVSPHPSRHSSDTLLDAARLDEVYYNNEGALIFAKGSPQSLPNVGHAMSFAIRRLAANPSEAFFGFFDPNVGMVLMKLKNFPWTRAGMQWETDVANDTHYPVNNVSLYNIAIHHVIEFFHEIQSDYDYQHYHCDKVAVNLKAEPPSPTRLRSPNKSPVMLSGRLSPVKSPRQLSTTLATASSIRKN